MTWVKLLNLSEFLSYPSINCDGLYIFQTIIVRRKWTNICKLFTVMLGK